ncbi:MAG: ATP synthase F1 subunit epsilon [Bacteroidota bacterium]
MFLEIVTPAKKVFEGEVSVITFPGVDGQFQVLNDHAPLVSTLKAGQMKYKDGKNESTIEITGGVVEVLHNKVIVLADGLT